MITLSHIVAVSENNAIGFGNDLPWSIPEDLKFFKEKTLNSIIIMGRKTYDSIGRPLPKRTTIVISRTASQSQFPKEVLVVPSLEEALEKAVSLAEKKNLKEIFITGGGEIYKQSLNKADRIYLTKVHRIVKGDVFYPEFNLKDFKIISERPSKDDKNSYTFYEYERI